MNEGRELLVSRSFPVPMARVFEALVNPKLLMRWIGPRDSVLLGCEVDARVGGRFRFSLEIQGMGQFALAGTYRAVEPPQRLAFSWGIEGEDDDSEVSIQLDEAGGVTTLLLAHRGLSLDEIGQNEAGWNEFFDRLAEMFG